jgi:hypothetical protein
MVALASVSATSLAVQLHLRFCHIIIFHGIVLIFGTVGLHICFVIDRFIIDRWMLHSSSLRLRGSCRFALALALAMLALIVLAFAALAAAFALLVVADS